VVYRSLRTTSRILLAALSATVLLTGCDAVSTDRPAASPTDDYTLPPDASPKLKAAFTKAEQAERKRSTVAAKSVAVVRRYPVPSVPAASEPPEPDALADEVPPADAGPADGGPEEAAPADAAPDEAAPADAAPADAVPAPSDQGCAGDPGCRPVPPEQAVPAAPARRLPPRVVLPEPVPAPVRAAMNDWARAQREVAQRCSDLRREAAAEQTRKEGGEQVGRISQPVCGTAPVPAEFLPWLQEYGLDENTFVDKGI
jgi:hypothetical protein